MSRKILTDVFPDWLTGSGIFEELQDFSVPWAGESINAYLDIAYFGMHSGSKPVSVLVENIMTGDELSAAEITLIATTCVALYNVNWTKQWATLSAQYDPIQNYSMTETMTDDETVIDYGKTNTRTDDLTNTTANDIFGFNSTTAVDTGGSEVTQGGTVTDVQTGSDTHTRNYTLEREGNIGVTTSQQMLQSERDLWMWNYFNDVVFPDLDKVLALSVYEN